MKVDRFALPHRECLNSDKGHFLCEYIVGRSVHTEGILDMLIIRHR